MKTLKHSFVVLLVLALITVMLPTAFAENAYCSFDEESGTLTVNGEGEITKEKIQTYAFETINVIIGQGITAIGDEAFEDFFYLTSVSLPNSLTEIGDGAFRNCVSLKKLLLSENVESTGAYAFENCFSLEDFTILNKTCDISLSMPCLAPYISDNENETKTFINDYITAKLLLNSGKELTEDESGLISYITAMFEYADIRPVKDAVITGYAYSTADVYAGGHNITFNCLCPTNHKNTTFTAAVDSTCISNGNTAYYSCSDCQRHFTDSTFETPIDIYDTVLPAGDHTPVADETSAVSPTCTEKGCSAATVCSLCGELIKASEPLAAKGHTDKNDDGICDVCGEEVTVTKTPSALERILNFLKDIFTRISEFFTILFGNN